MFYDNGEKELFPPPSRDFVSVLECIVDLKKQDVPALTGKLRINVLFDRETKKAKVDAFHNFIKDKYTGLLSDGGLELNIRYCRREGHHVGTVKTVVKDKDFEDFGYKKGVTDGSLKNA